MRISARSVTLVSFLGVLLSACSPNDETNLEEKPENALTYHQDGSSFVVVDVASGTYYLMDACGPDDSNPIGRSAAELLDWLWSNRIPPNDR